MQKTNKDWYPFVEVGGYFKLEDGLLMGCPMNADGSRDDSPCDIDLYEVEPEERDRIFEIEKELEQKL